MMRLADETYISRSGAAAGHFDRPYIRCLPIDADVRPDRALIWDTGTVHTSAGTRKMQRAARVWTAR